MKRLPASLLIVLAVALWGCQGQDARDAAGVIWPGLGDPYIQATRDWTRDAELTDGIDVRVKASATLKSRAWREAYVKRYAETYALTEEERAKLLDDQMRAHSEYIDVVLAMSGESSKLSSEWFRDPLWRIFASLSGKRIYLSEIRPLARDDWPPEKLKAFFPYHNRWRKFYELRFPRPAEGPFSLTVAGPAGEMLFSWPGLDGEPK